MTGWTQATVRFADEEDAREFAYSDDISRHGNIVRFRRVGYHNHDNVVRMLKEAGPIELALVADFNDTTDSGEVSVYNPRAGWEPVGKATCPEASRWSFRYEVGDLVETGLRAGRDFTLEEQYGGAVKEFVSLEEVERIIDEQAEMAKVDAQCSAIER